MRSSCEVGGRLSLPIVPRCLFQSASDLLAPVRPGAQGSPRASVRPACHPRAACTAHSMRDCRSIERRVTGGRPSAGFRPGRLARMCHDLQSVLRRDSYRLRLMTCGALIRSQPLLQCIDARLRGLHLLVWPEAHVLLTATKINASWNRAVSLPRDHRNTVARSTGGESMCMQLCGLRARSGADISRRPRLRVSLPREPK